MKVGLGAFGRGRKRIDEIQLLAFDHNTFMGKGTNPAGGETSFDDSRTRGNLLCRELGFLCP